MSFHLSYSPEDQGCRPRRASERENLFSIRKALDSVDRTAKANSIWRGRMAPASCQAFERVRSGARTWVHKWNGTADIVLNNIVWWVCDMDMIYATFCPSLYNPVMKEKPLLSQCPGSFWKPGCRPCPAGNTLIGQDAYSSTMAE